MKHPAAAAPSKSTHGAGKKHGSADGQSGTTTVEVPDWLMGNITEAIKNTQQVFFLLLSVLAYCAVTVVGSSDRQIALNSTVQLPILNSSGSYVGFMSLAPAVALLVYVYLQLNVARLQKLVQLVKSSYTPVEPGRFYPWVFTVVESKEAGLVGTIQAFMTSMCLWWALPVVLMMFSLTSRKKHSIAMTSIVGLYQFTSVAIGYYFWKHFQELSSARRRLDTFSRLCGGGLLLCSASILLILSPMASSGLLNAHLPTCAFGFVGKFAKQATTVDLSYQVLITEQKKEYDTYWADMEGIRFEGANLKQAILKLANLRNAHLQGADCTDTTFRTAMMEGADFRGAILDGADLSYAKLRGARNLTMDQLCRARTVYAAKLDGDLAQAVTSHCPNLLTVASQDW